MIHKAPYGTIDILPRDIPLWEKIEEEAKSLFLQYGYQQIRTPIFEYTALFDRSLGGTTDIIEKQMYTIGEGDESLTLRPELTAPTVRAFIEHHLYKERSFQKFYYIGPAMRRERPQKGRFRQFHQLGVEAIGSYEPLLDVEGIALFVELLKKLSIKEYTVNINSIGCPSCRQGYKGILTERVFKRLGKFCEDCRRRFHKNPLRILDCKNSSCRGLLEDLPKPLEYLCRECKDHFEEVLSGLKDLGVDFSISPYLVRGLDYYTRTVYEITSSRLGSQDAICSGGRYDNLVEELGGPSTGAVGFAAGIERMIMLMKNYGKILNPPGIGFFIVYVSKDEKKDAFRVLQKLRNCGASADMDYQSRSIKAQMRLATKLGARFALILGKEELQKGVIKLKEMASGKETQMSEDALREFVKRCSK
jgi:histidyl-tRNA synthetase